MGDRGAPCPLASTLEEIFLEIQPEALRGGREKWISAQGSVALPASFSILPPLWALKEALLILGRPFLWRESRCRPDTHLKQMQARHSPRIHSQGVAGAALYPHTPGSSLSHRWSVVSSVSHLTFNDNGLHGEEDRQVGSSARVLAPLPPGPPKDSPNGQGLSESCSAGSQALHSPMS